MDHTRGHADDLETLFARYPMLGRCNKLEETSEMSITDAPD